jgi:polyisoprenoid-binding protein YceI
MATFQLDPNHTAVEFSAKHLMVTTVRGRFTQYEGQVEVSDDLDPTTASGTFTIKTGSVSTGNEQRDGHLQSPDFFDSATYPDMTFTSTGIRKDGDGYKVTGDLTIRDVTKPITLEVVIEDTFIDPFGLQRVGLMASAEINRTDWGLNWNQTLEAGRLLVSEKVKISVEGALVRPAAVETAQTA